MQFQIKSQKFSHLRNLSSVHICDVKFGNSFCWNIYDMISISPASISRYNLGKRLQFSHESRYLTWRSSCIQIHFIHLHKFLFLQTCYLYFQVGYCCIRIKSIFIPYLPPQLRVGVIEKDLHKNSFEQKTVFSDWHNQSSLSLI